MGAVSVLLVVHLLFTAAYAGFQWTVRGVVYPQMALVPPEAGPGSGTATLLALPVAVLAALVLTTAVTEEIIWRGYTIEALGEVTGRRWLGAAVSFGGFGFCLRRGLFRGCFLFLFAAAGFGAGG